MSSEYPAACGGDPLLNNLSEGYIRKYKEYGPNADLFRNLRDIIGPEDFMKISKNLIGLAIESNKIYNDETGEIETVVLNQKFAKEVMAILNPGPKPERKAEGPVNLYNIFENLDIEDRRNLKAQNPKAA